MPSRHDTIGRAAPALSSVPAPAGAPRPRVVPAAYGARGVVLCIGLNEAKAAATGTDLRTIAKLLHQQVAALAPEAEIYAALTMAPDDLDGRDLDIVRSSLHDLDAGAVLGLAAPGRDVLAERRESSRRQHGSLVIDAGRREVLADGEPIQLTYLEFEVLRLLALRRGSTISREELRSEIDGDASTAGRGRAIDVHIARLRRKLGRHGELICTVRGRGYRIDEHADVDVRMVTPVRSAAPLRAAGGRPYPLAAARRAAY